MHDNDRTINSLSRIEGQIKGIKKMVEDNRYCEEVIMQLMAVNGAINSLTKNILNNHIKGCIVDNIKTGDADKGVEELIELVDKLFKVRY